MTRDQTVMSGRSGIHNVGDAMNDLFFTTKRMLRARWPAVGAALAVMLLSTGCGSTLTTRVRSHPVVEGNLPQRDVARDVRATERNHPDWTELSIDALVTRAEGRADRLAEVAEILLVRMNSRPVSRAGLDAGYALAACELAGRSLRASGVATKNWLKDPRTVKAMQISSQALSAFVARQSDLGEEGWGVLSVETPLGPRRVKLRMASPSAFPDGYFDELIPADYMEVSGLRQRTRTDGVGAALVGVRDRQADRREELHFQPPRQGVVAPLGSWARFGSGGTVELELFDLNRVSEARVGGTRLPLAGDFSAPFAISFSGINDLLIGVKALLNVELAKPYTGIYLTEPFDPKRIPVLLLHGLTSSPLVWRNVATDAMRDPELRKNYQFWYAFYSSGVPVSQSAALIRRQITEIRRSGDPAGTSRASNNMVVVGYSMGGVIARLLVTDIGDRFWTTFSDKPFDEVGFSDTDRAELADVLFWPPADDIKQVIFLATPHQGASMADASFAQLGRRLVGLPSSLVQFQQRILNSMAGLVNERWARGGHFTGIDSLSPSAPVYEVFRNAPLVPGLTSHSIIGDRGRGDTPESSDGVVGYWSSHLDSAVSEIIVPTGHDVQTDLNSEAEIQRILRGNLE